MMCSWYMARAATAACVFACSGMACTLRVELVKPDADVIDVAARSRLNTVVQCALDAERACIKEKEGTHAQ